MTSVAISANHVSHKFGDIIALDNISLSIPAGSVFGLLGPNGAGKTTMVRVLNGIITPSGDGDIKIFGLDLKEEAELIRQKIGVQTDTNLYERLTALENLQIFGELYGFSAKEAKQRAYELLAQFELSERLKEKVESFSKGIKQKLSIARALISDPDLVYLDEPTAGLDPEASYELLQYIRIVSSDKDKTFFITSHRLEEMESICNIVAILDHGQLKAIGTPQNLAREIIKEHIVIIEADPVLIFQNKHIISDLPFVTDLKIDDSRVTVKIDSRESIPQLIRKIAASNIDIFGVYEYIPTLKDAYLKLIKENKQ